MDTGPQEASWAERCSHSSPTSRDEGEDQPGRVSPTSQGGHENRRGRVSTASQGRNENGRGRVSPASQGRNENGRGRVSPASQGRNEHGRGRVSSTGRGRNNDGLGRVSPTSRGRNEDDRGRVSPTGRGRNNDGPETVSPTSRGSTGTENLTTNRKLSENFPTMRNTNPRENTPDSSPPVQADPLTCESIGSFDIIDMPNSDDHKKEVQLAYVAAPGLSMGGEPAQGIGRWGWGSSPTNYLQLFTKVKKSSVGGGGTGSYPHTLN